MEAAFIPVLIGPVVAVLHNAVAPLGQVGIDANILAGFHFHVVRQFRPFAFLTLLRLGPRLDAKGDGNIKPEGFTVGPVVGIAGFALGMDMDTVFAGANRA